MAKDFTCCIVGKMYGRYTQADLSKEFGLTQQGMGYKIRRANFTYPELLKLFSLLDFSDDEILKYMKAGPS